MVNNTHGHPSTPTIPRHVDWIGTVLVPAVRAALNPGENNVKHVQKEGV